MQNTFGSNLNKPTGSNLSFGNTGVGLSTNTNILGTNTGGGISGMSGMSNTGGIGGMGLNTGFQNASSLNLGGLIQNKPLLPTSISSTTNLIRPTGLSSLNTNTNTGSLNTNTISNTPKFGSSNTSGFFGGNTLGNLGGTNLNLGGTNITTTNTNTNQGGLFASNTTSNLNTGLFGASQNKPSFLPSTTLTSVSNPTNFLQTQNVNQNFNLNQQQNQNINQNQQFQNTNPIFTIPANNYTKYEKVESVPFINELLKQVETSLQNNDINLQISENLITYLYEIFKNVTEEGQKLVKYCKLINSKKSKINFITTNLKNEVAKQSDMLEKEKRNYHILISHQSMKIASPSDYFVTLTQELEEKINSQIRTISDIEALVNLHYGKEYGNFNASSDLVEETVRNLYLILIDIVAECAKINEYVADLRSNYADFLKTGYGFKDYEIEGRIRQAILSVTSEEEKNGLRERIC